MYFVVMVIKTHLIIIKFLCGFQ